MRGPEPVANEDKYFADIESSPDEIVITGPSYQKRKLNRKQRRREASNKRRLIKKGQL